MHQLLTVLISILLILPNAGGTTLPQNDDVLFTVNDHPVTKKEFIYVFTKNSNSKDTIYTKEAIDDYLSLYINFKLKIAEAYNRNMDKSPTLQSELKGYIEQLQQPYLTENKVTETLLNQAYERYTKELRASHILFNIDDGDTLSAYKKAMEVRDMALKGEPFSKLALQYSQDPSAKINFGDLGYFTSFQMVYPFENGAFNTEVGKISMPVRTQFGYHLIKVNDIRASHGTVQVAHIMLRHQPDSAMVRQKIFDIYDQAVGGVDWDELVMQYTDDVNSKRLGGKLRPFTVGQMPFPFQEAAYNLTEEGQISDPVKTRYGWHVIKFINATPPKSFDEMAPQFEERINKDMRSALNQKMLVKRLKNENGFKSFDKNIARLKKKLDTTFMSGKWQLQSSKDLKLQLLQIGDETFNATSFVDFVNSQKLNKELSPEMNFDQQFQSFIEEEIIDYEKRHLADKYLDYKMLALEYTEGILLFEIMQNEVWNKAIKDTVGLQQYYEAHKDEYVYQSRAEAVIYSAKEARMLAKIRDAIIDNDTIFLSKENLYKVYNNTSQVFEMKEGTFEKNSYELINNVKWQVGVYNVTFAGKDHLIWIKAILSPRIKKFNEARGVIIADYQKVLEEQWIEKLKSQYTVEVNNEVLEDIYDELSN